MEYLLCEQFKAAVSEVFRVSNVLSETIELAVRMGKKILNDQNSTEPPLWTHNNCLISYFAPATQHNNNNNNNSNTLKVKRIY